MRKPKLEKNLKMALEYRDLLLWQISGGTMGKAPSKSLPPSEVTFSEKKAFLDTMLKAAALVRNSSDEKETETGLEQLMKGGMNGSGKSASKGNPWREHSSDAAEPTSSGAEAGDEG